MNLSPVSSNWTYDLEENDNFGNGVGIYKNIAVVGSYNRSFKYQYYDESVKDFLKQNCGMVYIYKYDLSNDTWNNYVVLHPQINGDAWIGSTPPSSENSFDYESGSLYGDEISISDKYIGITARHKTIDNNSKNGAIYITSYNVNNTSQQEYSSTLYKTVRIVCDDVSPNNYFGTSISIVGEYCIVTSNDDTYVFKNNGNSTDSMNWQQVKKFSGMGTSGESCLTSEHVIICGGSTVDDFNVYKISDNFALIETFNLSNVLPSDISNKTIDKVDSDGNTWLFH